MGGFDGVALAVGEGEAGRLQPFTSGPYLARQRDPRARGLGGCPALPACCGETKGVPPFIGKRRSKVLSLDKLQNIWAKPHVVFLILPHSELSR